LTKIFPQKTKGFPRRHPMVNSKGNHPLLWVPKLILLLELAFFMLSCFLSFGRMCSSEWFDKKDFSHCGKDLHRTISVLDHTLFLPSSSLNNFKRWQETTMASLPVCKNTQIRKMPCIIDDFLRLFDREKNLRVLSRVDSAFHLPTNEHRCLSFPLYFVHLDKIDSRYFCTKMTDSHRSRNQNLVTLVFLSIN